MKNAVQEIIETIKEIQGFGEIITGTEKELEIVDHIIGELRNLGIDVSKIPVKVMSWQPIDATIRIGEKEIKATLQPYSLSYIIDGRLIYIRNMNSDINKIEPYESIALVELSTILDDYELQYYKLINAGALAIIFYDPYPNRRRRLVATGSLSYSFTPGSPLPIPILHVTRSEGIELLKNEGRRITIATRSKIDNNAIGYNIVATIPGRTSKRVILSAHHDHWFTGASDNIIGVATILEIAKHMVLEEIRYTLQIISFTAEESGAPGFTPWYWAHGSRVFVKEQEELGVLDDIIAVLNIDAVARGVLNINASGIEYQALLKSIAEKLGIEYKVGLDHPYYDSFSFSMKGIPSATLNTLENISDIYHTDKDTVEILDYSTVKNTFTLALETLRTLLKSSNPLKEYGYLTYASRIYRILEDKPVELKVRGYRLLEATRKALSEGRYDKLFKAYREINKGLIKPLFRGKYDEDIGGFETVLMPHLEIIEDMKKIRRIIELLRKNKISDALKALEEIPVQRIIPGEEKIISESLSRKIYAMLSANPVMSENIMTLLNSELNSLSMLLDYTVEYINIVLDNATDILIALD